VADAHGFIATPKSEFKSGASQSTWVAEFTSPWGGKKWTAADYAKAAPGKGFATLRSFLENRGPNCGNTLPNASPKPIPADKTVKFSRAMVHPGPCEIWLDDKRVYSENDCEAKFGKSVPTWNIDFSACKGKCMLRFYWLGLQDGGARWQSYKNCVPLKAGGARSMDDEDEVGADADAAEDTETEARAADDDDDQDASEDTDDSEERALNSTLSVNCKTKKSKRS
ncbi:hypothetical protein PybrP1_010040, partial [[Pythium] brassicae (nom. inval.)]